MKHIAAASLVVLCTLATQAHAQQPQRGWYAGVSAGQSTADIDNSSVLPVFGATASRLSTDDTDTAFKLYGGYRFNRHLAVEAGYADLGSFRATRTVTAPAAGTISGEFKVSGIFGQAVGIIPLGERFSIFGTAGVYANEVKTSAASTGAVVLFSGSSASNSDVNGKVGIGAGFDFNNKLGLRVEWERFFDLGDTSVGATMDVDLVTIGIVYRF
jgi:OOP family OmpA-OmpF porin